MKHYQAPLSVIVAGPFLVGGTSVNTYGLDLTFHRDWHGRLAIPASQIKGALRSSLSEIGGCSSHPLVDIPKLFGQASGDTGGDYAPKRALLAFSDLVCQQQAAASTRPQHRVTIDTQSGTAAHRKLRTIERPFASGEPVT